MFVLPPKKCLRCGHEWVARMLNPKICPRCKSPYWNKTRTRKATVRKIVEVSV